MNESEKQWLKDNYNGELHVLITYSLFIYKAEDRNEGRRVLHSIIDDDSDERPNHSGDEASAISGVNVADVASEEHDSRGSIERKLETIQPRTRPTIISQQSSFNGLKAISVVPPSS